MKKITELTDSDVILVTSIEQYSKILTEFMKISQPVFMTGFEPNHKNIIGFFRSDKKEFTDGLIVDGEKYSLTIYKYEDILVD